MAAARPLTVVANRLPVQRGEDGKWIRSPGGLVSALEPVFAERGGAWIGWTGDADAEVSDFRLGKLSLYPVPISSQELSDFYLGFCNATIWPLYHDAVRTPEFHRHWWKPYQNLNHRFAERTSKVAEENAIIWIHDYQLQLVPLSVREKRPDLTIGFYLHTPFPPPELFSRMPWRTQIMEGLLGADVIGVQTPSSASNLARAAILFAGAKGNSRELVWRKRRIRIHPAPISIDFRRYDTLAQDPKIIARAQEIKSLFGKTTTLILGVDRLDYTKGIDVRLRAFETLLDQSKGSSNNYTMLQIAVPSRTDVDDYAEMRQHIEEIVGRINGRFWAPGQVPLHYLYGSLPVEELVAYYVAADVMMVTPLKDGMNLVAKEYVAARTSNTGVLILSEFAGAAAEMPEAIMVNPHDLDGVAEVLESAVKLEPTDAHARMATLREKVRRHDVFHWAQQCLNMIEP